MPVDPDVWEMFTEWLEHVRRFTVRQFVEDSGRWTTEVPVEDWRTRGDAVVYLAPFEDRTHTLRPDALATAGDDWTLTSGGIRFLLGFVWTTEQEEELARWAREKDPATVEIALSEGAA